MTMLRLLLLLLASIGFAVAYEFGLLQTSKLLPRLELSHLELIVVLAVVPFVAFLSIGYGLGCWLRSSPLLSKAIAGAWCAGFSLFILWNHVYIACLLFRVCL